jgi:hypothetical protein
VKLRDDIENSKGARNITTKAMLQAREMQTNVRMLGKRRLRTNSQDLGILTGMTLKLGDCQQNTEHKPTDSHNCRVLEYLLGRSVNEVLG